MGNVADPRLPEALRRVAKDWLAAIDPAELLRANGLRPDDWQLRLLRSSSKRLLVVAPRQSGKSSGTAGVALATALFRPGSLTVVLAPSERQSSELLRKVKRLLRPFSERWRLTTEAARELAWSSGSRVVCLPGSPDTVRTFSPDLVIVDEASYTKDELFAAVRPMVSVTDGRIVALSSAGARRGWFFEAWESGTWETIHATSRDNPRISPEELEDQRRTLGPVRFAREHLSEFVDNVEDTERNPFIFGAMKDLLDEAFADAIVPLEEGRP